jgi:hypothetical protein
MDQVVLPVFWQWFRKTAMMVGGYSCPCNMAFELLDSQLKARYSLRHIRISGSDEGLMIAFIACICCLFRLR